MVATDVVVSVPIYDETKKETVEQTVFETNSFDSNEDGLEMVPVTIAGVWRVPTDGDSLDQLDERPSNEKLLTTAFCSFTIFTVCQTIAAYIAGSEAMMGDSVAMFVDALTYLFNLVAERRKSRFEEYWKPPPDFPEDRERAKRLKERAKRKMALYLELIPPLISVSTLLTVTGFVLHQSVSILILDTHRNKSEQDDINVDLMLIFSTMNLLLDIFNVVCFARAKRLMGYQTTTQHRVPGAVSQPSGPITPTSTYAQISNQEANDSDFIIDDVTKELFESENPDPQFTIDEEPENDEEISKVSSDADTEPTANGLHTKQTGTFDEDEEEAKEEHDKSNSGSTQNLDGQGGENCMEGVQEEANLNMCSAYTHVFADTLRSIAVLLAAGIAMVADDVTSEEADSTAAVVVSTLILLSLVPLFQGLLSTSGELRAIRAEEVSEKMFPEQANKTNEIA